MSEIAAIGIDLGGTRIKGILLRDNAIEESIYKPTGAGDNFKNSILDTVNELRIKSGASNVVVGISAPGIPDSENKSIAVMPGRLPGLENFIWSDFLKVPAFVLNDAVCALVAEARLGAARGLNHVVMLTLGTGVGGAMLIYGSPYQGAFNKAGHWGHTSVDSEGFADVTAMPGSIEEAIGNVSIERRSLGQFKSTQELLDAVLDNLEKDHEFLTRGGVFAPDLIETWIEWKRKSEVDYVRLRPHPAEFELYFDI